MVVFSLAFLPLFSLLLLFLRPFRLPFLDGMLDMSHITHYRTESVHINSIQRRHRLNLALVLLWPGLISPDSNFTVERAREFTRVTEPTKGSWKSAHWLLQVKNHRFDQVEGSFRDNASQLILEHHQTRVIAICPPIQARRGEPTIATPIRPSARSLRSRTIFK
ncbi:hypothetical protein GGI43DRAFT_319024 [Trichoderma evansii]